MSKSYLVFPVLYLLIVISLKASASNYNTQIDSVKSVIAKQNNKELPKSFSLLAKLYLKTNQVDSTAKYARKTIRSSKQNKDRNILRRGYATMGNLYRITCEYDSAIYYYKKTLSLIDPENSPISCAATYNNLAISFSKQSKHDSSLYYYKKSLRIKEKLKNYEGMAKSLSNMGVLLWRQGKYSRAVDYFFQSLELRKEHNTGKKGISMVLNNIGSLYFQTEKYDLALKYYKESIKFKEKINDKRGVATTAGNIGAIYQIKEEWDTALTYMHKALKLKRELQHKDGVAGILSNIGSVYKNKKEYSKAEEYYRESLEIRREIDDPKGVTASLTNLGTLQLITGKLQASEKNLKHAIQIGEPKQFDRSLEEAYYSLSELYQKQGQNDKALEFYKKYHSLREKLLDEKRNKRIEKLEQKYQSKQQAEIIKRQKAENKLIQAKLKNSRGFTIFLIVTIILTIAIIVLLYQRNAVKNRHNKQLENLNADLDRRVRVRTQELQNENDVRRNIEKDLRESEEKYRTVTETVSAGIAIADVNERITFTNNAFCEMLGYEQEELLGNTVDMIVSEKTFEKFRLETQKRKKGKSNQYQVILHRKDGQEIQAILTASPLYNQNGDFIGGTAAVTNITELKKAENSLKNALIQAEKTNNIKNQFIGNINKEMRTPLNNINGMSEILLNDDSFNHSKEQNKMLESIRESANKVKLELFDLVNLSLIKTTDVQTKTESINIKSLMDELAQSLKNEKAVINFEMGEDLEVFSDRGILRKISGSLLENAINHSVDKDPVLKISKDEVKQTVNLEFLNYGKVIPEVDLEKILDPFDDTRIENPGQRSKQFDYSLVWIRKMVQILNGQFDFESKDGQTRAFISLPLSAKNLKKLLKTEEELIQLLIKSDSPLIMFTNTEKLKTLGEKLSHKLRHAEVYEAPKDYIAQLEEGKTIPANAIILIDNELEEPWTMEKTMLELKQRNPENAKFVAMVKDSCEQTSHLMETGFDICIPESEYISELNQFLRNSKAE